MTISGTAALSAYFVIFALVHSLLADPGFKSRARSRLGEAFDRYQRLGYNILALIMIMPFFLILVFLPGRTLYIIPAPWIYLTLSSQLLLALSLLLTLRQTGASSFLGLSGFWVRMEGDRERRSKRGREKRDEMGREGGLVTDGFYSHIRNPLFLFAALFLWLSPFMTESLLAFNILASIYFYLGARHEERSLRAEYGRAYEDYKTKVPMFLPRLRRREPINSESKKANM